MRLQFQMLRGPSLSLRLLLLVLIGTSLSHGQSAEPAVNPAVLEMEIALDEAKSAGSEARQRLAARRVIRDAEKRLEKIGNAADRWEMLELLFRARQQLVALDGDRGYREALIETSRELVKAPDPYAAERFEADLLLSQLEQAKKDSTSTARTDALRPFVDRYLDTPAAAKALRTAMLIGLELGDTRFVNDLREIIAERFSGDLEMITFLRDHLGGQVFGVAFSGHFKRSDGKTVLFPMDGLGHSSMVIFWSMKEESTLQFLADLAAAYKKHADEVDGRLEIISINLDDLPDAGESIIRRLGADWQCLHFPDGRDNPMYDAYARVDPLNMRVAPTGQVAMSMREAEQKPPPLEPKEVEEIFATINPNQDLESHWQSFRRTLIRSWSKAEYALHLSALMSGDFLIFDPEGGIDPARPPELKAAAMGGAVTPLKREANSVPEAALEEIQNCLIPPPKRYHSSVPEIRTAYRKMLELSRQAIDEHPDAPDLWIVRNRLITALLGLWKTDFNLEYFEAAVAESEAAVEAGYPEGTDVVARFCLARKALRDPGAAPGEVIDSFVADHGGESAPGPVLAVATLLALDVADADRYEQYRETIVTAHTEHPMMWIYSSFLLSRYHDYWMFHVPFTAGRSFGRRLKDTMNSGEAEEGHRMLRVELPTMDGETFRIPEDLDAEYNVIYVGQPSPWSSKDQDVPRPPSPLSTLRQFIGYAVSRPDVDLFIAMLGEDEEAIVRENIRVNRSEKQLESPILRIPGGMDHPLVHRLGLLDDHGGSVVLNKEGRIIMALSGVGGINTNEALTNTIRVQDENAVMDYLKEGNVQAAEELIMRLAPPFDPEAVDERGRKPRDPEYSIQHLRARTQVYMALEEWEKALADAEKIYRRELSAAGGMSIRTEELDQAEELRDSILDQINNKSE